MSTTLTSPSQRFARYARTVADRRENERARVERFLAGEPVLLEESKVVRPPRELPPAWPMVLALVPSLLAGLGALSFFGKVATGGDLYLMVAWLCVIPAVPFSLIAAPIPLLVRRGGAPGYIVSAAGPGFVLLGALLWVVGAIMDSAQGNLVIMGGTATLVVSPFLPIAGLGALWHHRSALFEAE